VGHQQEGGAGGDQGLGGVVLQGRHGARDTFTAGAALATTALLAWTLSPEKVGRAATAAMAAAGLEVR